MFGAKAVQISPAPFGPLVSFIPPANVLRDSKAQLQLQQIRYLHLDNPDFEQAARQASAKLGWIIEKLIVPALPSASAVGVPEADWPPSAKLAAAMGRALTLTSLQFGKVSAGFTSPGTFLAASMLFINMDDNPAVGTLLSWMSWVMFSAGVNEIGQSNLLVYLKQCLTFAGDLTKLA